MRPHPDFIHEFVPGSSERTLLLLHGTGGNERDLIPLGRFAGLGMIRCAKQDALRSFSEGGPVHYVYLIESLSAQEERYVEMTTDLKQRFREHNQGKSSHTAKFRPWKLISYIAFTNRAKAEAFERYLKSGSGHAFARKRLW